MQKCFREPNRFDALNIRLDEGLTIKMRTMPLEDENAGGALDLELDATRLAAGSSGTAIALSIAISRGDKKVCDTTYDETHSMRCSTTMRAN